LRINTLLSAKFINYWLLLFVCGQIISCGGSGGSVEHKALLQERLAQADWQSRRFSLSATVTDALGVVVSNATVSMNTATVQTDANGYFELNNLPPLNAFLRITHTDFRDEQWAVNLQLPMNSTSTSLVLKPIILTRTSASQVRFLFGVLPSFLTAEALWFTPINQRV